MQNEEHVNSLPVKTPEGILLLNVLRTISDENEENMQVTLCTTVRGKAVSFTAETTEAVLILLGKYLPKGWEIQSCISCRHGHFCPTGNRDNELFCVTDFDPKGPCDLWHVTENEEEREKRSRSFFDACAAHKFQSRAYYTYNDYHLMLHD